MLLRDLHQPEPYSGCSGGGGRSDDAGAPTDDALDKAPLAIREAMLFPYREGFAFVAALRRRQPWSEVDAAFKRPPRSTEHILHPEKYRADELPVAVTVQAPAALADQALIHTTVWGELGYELFLRAHGLDTRAAKQAAAGWGGHRGWTPSGA